VLHAAAASTRADAPACVRLLLREGAQIEACTSAAAGMVRPLQLACLGGRVASVALLLEFGADPAARDGHRRTPLHAACTVWRALAWSRRCKRHGPCWSRRWQHQSAKTAASAGNSEGRI